MNGMTMKNYFDFLNYVVSHADGKGKHFEIIDIDEKLMKQHIKDWECFFENCTQYIHCEQIVDAIADHIIFTTFHYQMDKFERMQAKREEYDRQHRLNKSIKEYPEQMFDD